MERKTKKDAKVKTVKQEKEKKVNVVEETRAVSKISTNVDGAHLEQLPLAVRSGDAAISHEDLEKLYKAFGGKDDKLYDSDDSLISEIDNMDAEELAKGSAQMMKNLADVDRFKTDAKVIKSLLAMNKKPTIPKIVIPKTSIDVKKDLEVASSELSTSRKRKSPEKPKKKKNSEKEVKEMSKMAQNMAKYMGVEKKETLEERKTVVVNSAMKMKITAEWGEKVQCFEQKEPESKLPYIKCKVFARILNIFANLVENVEASKHTKKIRMIEDSEVLERIEHEGININFWTEEKELVSFLKENIVEFLKNKEIKQITNGEKFGFDLNTKECLLAMRSQYLMKDLADDNGKSRKLLGIEMYLFIKACFTVKKQFNRDFNPNGFVKEVIFS